jgi:hypothetical protein
MSGLYAANGSINVTLVNYSKRGLHAPDGSYYAVESPGTSPVGLHHPSGALWVTEVDSSGVRSFYAKDGSENILTSGTQGTKVTVVHTINYADPHVLTNVSVFKVPVIAHA